MSNTHSGTSMSSESIAGVIVASTGLLAALFYMVGRTQVSFYYDWIGLSFLYNADTYFLIVRGAVITCVFVLASTIVLIGAEKAKRGIIHRFASRFERYARIPKKRFGVAFGYNLPAIIFAEVFAVLFCTLVLLLSVAALSGVLLAEIDKWCVQTKCYRCVDIRLKGQLHTGLLVGRDDDVSFLMESAHDIHAIKLKGNQYRIFN